MTTDRRLSTSLRPARGDSLILGTPAHFVVGAYTTCSVTLAEGRRFAAQVGAPFSI
jgi:hypothetical protein